MSFRLDPVSQAFFTELRNQFFPSERNFLDAHLTAFHLLPGEHREAIIADLKETAEGEDRIAVQVIVPRSLGRGVAFDLHSPEAVRLRGELAIRWAQWLGPQDRQGYRPHITVQNKVPPEVARRTLEELRRKVAPSSASLIGFDLWDYLGGPWKLIVHLPFVKRASLSPRPDGPGIAEHNS